MKTTTLYRPVNQAELDLIAALDFMAFPPRLPGQPIFYPVMNRAYACQISQEWNVPHYGCGHVTSFDVKSDFLSRYKVKNVGGKGHDELWIPAEELDEFNRNIVGTIRVTDTFRGE